MINHPKLRRLQRGVVALALLAVASAGARAGVDSISNQETVKAAPDVIPCSLWLTGQVFVRHGLLLFHTDVPVRTDNGENVVFLGATRELAQDLLPEYLAAARTGEKVRLYGSLIFSGPSEGLPSGAPPVEFITWKLHSPSAPDTIQASDRTMLTSTSIASYPDDGVYGPLRSTALPIHVVGSGPQVR